MQWQWSESSYRAAIASVVAQRFTRISPDKALLAGLLRDMGALPLLMKMEDREQFEYTAEEIQQAMDRYIVPVGAALANHWQLDESFVDVI